MSLVNDMLRDLDARQGAPRRLARIALEPAPPARRGVWQLIVLGVAGVLLVFVGAAAYPVLMEWKAPSMKVAADTADIAAGALAPVPEISAEIAQDVEIAVDEPDAQAEVSALAEGTPQGTDSVDHNEALTQAVANISASQTSAVAPLLAAAQEALVRDRLTRPPVHNAHALFSHVLLLEPGNQDAQKGIERIQQRYEEMVRAAIENRNWTDGLRYLRRAELVAMPGVQVSRLREALQQAREAHSTRMETAQSSSGVELPVRADMDNEVEQGTMAPSWRSREAAALRHASEFLDRNQRAQAVKILRNVAEAFPKAEAAAAMLFDLHLEAGDTKGTRRLQGMAQSPQLRNYYRARLLTDAGQHEDALRVLEDLSPSGGLRQPYEALQAALYQQEGQYEQAARLYQQLVRLDQRQPNYWLGLGVATQALGQRNQALQAFVMAEQLAPSDPAVSSYIKERIRALGD